MMTSRPLPKPTATRSVPAADGLHQATVASETSSRPASPRPRSSAQSQVVTTWCGAAAEYTTTSQSARTVTMAASSSSSSFARSTPQRVTATTALAACLAWPMTLERRRLVRPRVGSRRSRQAPSSSDSRSAPPSSRPSRTVSGEAQQRQASRSSCCGERKESSASHFQSRGGTRREKLSPASTEPPSTSAETRSRHTCRVVAMQTWSEAASSS
mmetsp:Transcript_16014/g.53993  ORF Transcript_16014/g.53993 Transcript_16014/m.53993 type:complete len:214 (+) Transcript_16014:2747-3388(+)